MKPREAGLHHEMDRGMSLRSGDFLEVSAAYTDVVKLGYFTWYLT
jgi:phosphosulfolactate synthase